MRPRDVDLFQMAGLGVESHNDNRIWCSIISFMFLPAEYGNAEGGKLSVKNILWICKLGQGIGESWIGNTKVIWIFEIENAQNKLDIAFILLF